METTALLLLRLATGLGLAAHGTQKGFGWFGGPGFKGATGFFESLGYRPAGLYLALAVAGEIAGGLLTAAGLLGPVGPSLIILVMIVAAGTVHISKGFFSQNGGVELHVLYIGIALLIALGGPGSMSGDSIFGIEAAYTPSIKIATLIAGVLLGFATLMVRRPKTA